MYTANAKRYDKMKYLRCGNSGLKLPRISLGLWQNFGAEAKFSNVLKMCETAFDNGITYFDIANNYGHPYNGSAEENFGRVLKTSFAPYRDELVIATKAGYDMWDGPYGAKGGSKKYLTASLDQSLKRIGVDYVDIFYHHVYDPDTPLEETAAALDLLVRQGKALYIGISNYSREQTKEISKIFDRLGTPFIINQPMYNMIHRWIEPDGLYDLCYDTGIGIAAYCPLAQGFLTDKYLNGIKDGSRASENEWLRSQLDDEKIAQLNALNDIAKERGQTLSQMAVSWVLREDKCTTVLIGASRPEQIEDNCKALQNMEFSKEEIEKIDRLTKVWD